MPTPYHTLDCPGQVAPEDVVESHSHRDMAASPVRDPTEARPPSDFIIDFRALEYTGSVDTNLVCPICQCPFLAPVKLRCDHLFCSDCLHLAARDDYERSTCPSCRQNICPSRSDAIQPVSRIITHMLDDLTVKCPSFSKGCRVELARSFVSDHIRKYCSYADVVCPAEDCTSHVSRQEFTEGRCLHSFVKCQDCPKIGCEVDLRHHRLNDCDGILLSCPHCGQRSLRSENEEHVKECPEIVVTCVAAPYGCDFQTKRSEFDDHERKCALAKLAPFLKSQNDKFQAQQRTLDRFRTKANILETAVHNITETLELHPDSIGTRASTIMGANTAHHLLCVDESLRRDVERVSMELSQLDAKASMMILNESLRAKDEMAHTNAAVSAVRTQVQWLTVANQQRAVSMRTHPSNYEAQAHTSVDTEVLNRVQTLEREQRLSDSTRQDTKL